MSGKTCPSNASGAQERKGETRETKMKRRERNTKRRRRRRGCQVMFTYHLRAPRRAFSVKRRFNPMRIRSARTKNRIHGVRRGSCAPRNWDWPFTKTLLCRRLLRVSLASELGAKSRSGEEASLFARKIEIYFKILGRMHFLNAIIIRQ